MSQPPNFKPWLRNQNVVRLALVRVGLKGTPEQVESVCWRGYNAWTTAVVDAMVELSRK